MAYLNVSFFIRKKERREERRDRRRVERTGEKTDKGRGRMRGRDIDDYSTFLLRTIYFFTEHNKVQGLL